MKPIVEKRLGPLTRPASASTSGYIKKRALNTLHIRKRVAPQQWKILLDYIEETPELINVYSHSTENKTSKDGLSALWNTMARHLNSVGLTRKTTAKWKTAVHDWKYKTKYKVMEIMKERPASIQNVFETRLTDNEKRLVNICGWGRNLSAIDQHEAMGSCEEITIKIEQSGSDSEEFREIVLDSVEVKPDIDPLFHFQNDLAFQTNSNNKIPTNPPLAPSSPPPLIPLQNKNLDSSGRPKQTPPPLTNNPKNDEAKDKNVQNGESVTSNSETQKELIEVLGSLASGIHGILGELKVISGALQKIADKK